MKKLLFVFLGFLIISSCKKEDKKDALIPVESISFPPSSTSLKLKVGETHTLKPDILPANASDKSIEWKSSDETVATVSKDGVATGMKVGSATITAKSKSTPSKTATRAVEVIVPVESVTFDPPALTLKVDEARQLAAIIAPTGATNKKITYSSDKSDIASVSAEGAVTAKAVGAAIITGTTEDGNKTATCTITVIPVPPTGIRINPAEASVLVNGELPLQVIFTPANATDNVTWTSSDAGKATVSATGLVRGIAVGAVTITATSATNAQIRATCQVRVTTTAVAVTGVSLNSTTLGLVEGQSRALIKTITPANATNQNVTYVSDRPNIATVSDAGVIRAIAAGTATITVTTADGNRTATCIVTVVSAVVAVTDVSLSPATLRLAVGGQPQPLIKTITPANATNQSVTYASNHADIATVSDAGVVTAVAAGTATITVTTADGNKTATCAVTVFIPVSTITLASNSTTLTVGGTAQLTPTVAPENASNKTVTWSSSDISKATVSSSGLVTGIARGSVTIIATAADGSAVKGEITFTVKSTDATVSAITLGAENFVVAVPAEGATTTITNAPRTVSSILAIVPVNITAADGATIKIATEAFTSGRTANFTNAVTFTVTAETGTTVKTYTVAITAYNAATNPYGIYTAKHLADVKNGLSANFLLKNAIDLPNATAQGAADATGISDYATAGWLPLGPFTGTFDGGNFSINNFYANRAAEKVGLFGELGSGGTIRNLGVNGVSGTAATGNSGTDIPCFTGILVGRSFGTIDKCYATGSVSSSSSGGLATVYAGGLVGHSAGGAISNSYATGNASAVATTSFSVAGGLVGYSDSAISNSYATGNASASSAATVYAGGLAGIVDNIAVSNSYATGSASVATTSDPAIGGFVGSGTLGTPGTRYTNCFRNSEATLTVTRNGVTTTQNDAARVGITAKTIAEMQDRAFLTLLNAGTTVWGQDRAKNNGLPFIIGVGVGKP